MEEKIKNIEKEYLEKISSSESLKELDEIFLELFGKNGVVTLLPKDFPNLDREELKVIGPLFNKTKQSLENKINDKRDEIRELGYQKLSEESMDLERGTEIKRREGILHPLTRFEREIIELFQKLDFSQFDAPHIDSDYYNFEVLNIPEGHPARDLWDTFYIDKDNLGDINQTLLLKTHTSNAQVRIMEKTKIPFRMLVLDRCFRHENLDARHEHTFDQFEVVLVQKGASMANLQFLSEYFFKSILGKDIEVRMRPKSYPFVEPTAGIDAQCIFCKGAGCKICGEGWIELAGAGMIHPVVLRNGGIDPNEYSGIAWGAGIDRIVMMKYGVDDVRLFRSGDLDFLNKFKEDK